MARDPGEALKFVACGSTISRVQSALGFASTLRFRVAFSLSRTRARVLMQINLANIIIHAEEGGRSIPPEGYSGARYLVFFRAGDSTGIHWKRRLG